MPNPPNSAFLFPELNNCTAAGLQSLNSALTKAVNINVVTRCEHNATLIVFLLAKAEDEVLSQTDPPRKSDSDVILAGSVSVSGRELLLV